jgi:hypothetical protein
MDVNVTEPLEFFNPKQYVVNPFLDLATENFPTNIYNMLRWSEYIFLSNGVYRQALDRIVSYFITDIEFSDQEDDQQVKLWRDFFYEVMDINNLLHQIGLELMCYGNCFISVIGRHERYLSCNGKLNDGSKCGLELKLSEIYNNPIYEFKWVNFSFHAKCPRCGYVGEWERVDRYPKIPENIIVKRWDPHFIVILHNLETEENRYIWRIPEDYRQQIRQGNLYHLERANWDIVEAVKNNQDILFNKNNICHLYEYIPSGIRNRGWGISRTIMNFRQLWYLQLLLRFNEAIASDYIIPFRVITPPSGANVGGGLDPLSAINMASFSSKIERLLQLRRKDPASWYILPFPIQYQVLGGEAKALAPAEQINQAIEMLYASIGIPVEFYRGTLQMQALPIALRLFEMNWSHLQNAYNKFLTFLIKRVSQILSWKPVQAKLAKVSHIDDIQKQQLRLQLMLAGQISPSTALQSIGIDYRSEVQKMLQDQKFQLEQQEKLQRDLLTTAQLMSVIPQVGSSAALQAAMSQALGGAGGAIPGGAAAAPGGSAPPAGGGGASPSSGPLQTPVDQILAMANINPNKPVNIEELWGLAQQIAGAILGLPETMKDSVMIRLKRINPTIHAMVKEVLAEIRSKAEMMGRAFLQQQGGPPM